MTRPTRSRPHLLHLLPVLALVGATALTALSGATPAVASGGADAGSRLSRGAPPAVPWVLDGTLRDGRARVDLGLRRVYGVERAAGGWLVQGQVGSDYTLLAVDRDGDRRRLVHTLDTYARSADGRRVAAVGYREDAPTPVTLQRVSDGAVLGSRRFANPRVLAVRRWQVLLSVSPPAGRQRVVWWNAADGTLRHVVRGAGLRADVRANRLVLAGKGSPCDQRLVRLDRPRRVVTGLAGLTPLSWNATGHTMLMSDCYFDAPWSRRVVVRTDPGQDTLSRTTTRSTGGDRLSAPVWETRTSWLVLRFDEDRAVVQRCNRRATRCERATRAWPTRLDRYDGGLRRPQLVLGTR